MAATWGPGPTRFLGLYESEEALFEAALGALERQDRETLESLALSKTEYQKEVFPEMPVYGNIPEDLAWNQFRLKSHYGLSKLLRDEGGRIRDFEHVIYEGGHTEYGSFVVHREPVLVLRDLKTGQVVRHVLSGSVLEYQGRFKLLSYNIDR